MIIERQQLGRSSIDSRGKIIKRQQLGRSSVGGGWDDHRETAAEKILRRQQLPSCQQLRRSPAKVVVDIDFTAFFNLNTYFTLLKSSFYTLNLIYFLFAALSGTKFFNIMTLIIIFALI
jgi:hypothetical protein